MYFDLPRPPWKPHVDRCIPYLVRVLRDLNGLSPDEILRRVDGFARGGGFTAEKKRNYHSTREEVFEFD